MNPNEKAQRLMLVTDIKFRLDEITGDIVECDSPISQQLIDEAMNMTDEEFAQRSMDLQIRNRAILAQDNVAVKCAYYVYTLNNQNPVALVDFIEASLKI